ncbi:MULTISPECIES: hypothetical protein [Tenacibaculum]|uniref:Lipoprotein n=1 Tax=Tenacibaculum mesophilum TaxID=104268 RepID=A0AAE9SFX9_9FLAO|nr:hypothetical protein [Tenacibaculum mesophilum]GFD71453.1 hypothetical protein KUL113_08730 [Tenacibaculum sp. KUL113]GFD81506.1 hypothetical protein KUL118_43680 [Tenacibaculum sp. KUL118]GFD95098.1 hypothetical protein KUL154_38310 [Alteromonas sp. KUL154]GFE02096.1 hypothetical protein KUL156_46880 [Alteromonas sp. KUL156]KAF9659611.1 hypothetical protein HBA12_05045 [Tenacibaculum mesophilum]
MSRFLFVIASLLISVTSCKKKNEQKEELPTKTEMNISVEHTDYSKINEKYVDEIKPWKEYFIVEDFLQELKNTTPTEALNNALELKTLTKQLKDSLNIETLKTPAFKARINVFENETLRLADMTFIPSISANQVNSQVEKIMMLFSSVNDKINTVYTKKKFDSEINLDSLFKNQ